MYIRSFISFYIFLLMWRSLLLHQAWSHPSRGIPSMLLSILTTPPLFSEVLCTIPGLSHSPRSWALNPSLIYLLWRPCSVSYSFVSSSSLALSPQLFKHAQISYTFFSLPLQLHEASCTFCPIFHCHLPLHISSLYPAFLLHPELPCQGQQFLLLLLIPPCSIWHTPFSPSPLFPGLFGKWHFFHFHLNAAVPQVSTLLLFLVYFLFLCDLTHL